MVLKALDAQRAAMGKADGIVASTGTFPVVYAKQWGPQQQGLIAHEKRLFSNYNIPNATLCMGFIAAHREMGPLFLEVSDHCSRYSRHPHACDDQFAMNAYLAKHGVHWSRAAPSTGSVGTTHLPDETLRRTFAVSALPQSIVERSQCKVAASETAVVVHPISQKNTGDIQQALKARGLWIHGQATDGEATSSSALRFSSGGLSKGATTSIVHYDGLGEGHPLAMV